MGNPRPWCFILGASSGMGEACARQLHAEGMNVYGLHLDPSSAQPHLDQLVADLSGDGTRFRLVNANAARRGCDPIFRAGGRTAYRRLTRGRHSAICCGGTTAWIVRRLPCPLRR